MNTETALNNSLTLLITIAEDGGEMIVGSFGCAGALAALVASRQTQSSQSYKGTAEANGVG